MRVLRLLLVLVLLFSLLSISCSKEEKKELRQCERNSDCIRVIPNNCFTPKCTADGKCISNPKQDCCGNKVCEASSFENKCTCPFDCGNCTGFVTFNVTSYGRITSKNAQYAIYMCRNKECVIGVDQTKVRVLNMVDDLVVYNAFKSEVLTTLNTPFDLAKDKLKVEVSLKDRDAKLSGPVVFKEIKVLSDANELMGRVSMNESLDSVGSMFTEELSLVSSQKLVEQDKFVYLEISYEYNKLEPDYEAKVAPGEPRPTKPVTYRSSSKLKLAQKPVFVAQELREG